MDRIAELRMEIQNKMAELSKKIEARDIEGARALKEDISKTKELLSIALEQEEDEKDDLSGQKRSKVHEEEIEEMRCIVKSVMGAKMTAEERAVIKTSDNSAVVPKQFVNKIEEIKKGYGSLKEYCDVIPVTKNEGTIPVIDLDQNELPEVEEGDNIVDGTLVTTEIPFKCHKHGLIQPLSSELVDDAEVEIKGLVNKNFTEIVTVVENFKILKVIKENAGIVEGSTSYENIEKTIDESLPAVKRGLVTLTNTKGFAFIKNLKDKQGRPLKLVTEINGKFYFNGKELLIADDTLLPASEGKKVYYVANMKEAVKFTDRGLPTIARSKEAGFKDDAVLIRILERFGVQKGSTRSIKKIEF